MSFNVLLLGAHMPKIAVSSRELHPFIAVSYSFLYMTDTVTQVCPFEKSDTCFLLISISMGYPFICPTFWSIIQSFYLKQLFINKIQLRSYFWIHSMSFSFFTFIFCMCECANTCGTCSMVCMWKSEDFFYHVIPGTKVRSSDATVKTFPSAPSH